MTKLCSFALVLLAFATIVHAQPEYSDWQFLHPYPTNSPLDDVWGTAGNNVFAVGANGTILHYDGTLWRLMKSCTSEDLWAVQGRSGTDVYAVGDNSTVLHFNGTTWTSMAVDLAPADGVPDNVMDFTSIWLTPGDARFLGVPLDGSCVFCPFFVQHDGAQWTTLLFGQHWNAGAWSNGTGAFAVGSDRFGDGRVWYFQDNSIPAPGDLTPASNRTFTSVWGFGPGSVFALANNNFDAYLYEYDGATWTVARFQPNAGVALSVWGSAPDSLFFTINNHVERLAGTTWNTDIAASTNVVFTGIWGTDARDVFVVGSDVSLNYGVIYHYDGAWSEMSHHVGGPLLQTPRLTGVWGSDEDHLHVVGDGGLIMNYDTGTWTLENSGTGFGLTDIIGVGTDTLFAGGLRTILRSVGGVWSPTTLTANGTVTALWGTAQADLLAAIPDDNALLAYVPASNAWAPAPGFPVAGEEIHDMWGTIPGSILAVGRSSSTGPAFYRYDGTSLSVLPAPPGAGGTVEGIWGTDNNLAFAAGGSFLYKYDGTWNVSLNAAPTDAFHSVWAARYKSPIDSLEIWAVGQSGLSGLIAHSSDGTSWQLETIPIDRGSSGAAGLFGIFGFAPRVDSLQTLIVTGANQTVLINKNPIRGIVPVFFTGFTAVPEGRGVSLEWRADADEPIDSWHVHRKEIGESTERQIAVLPARGPREYLDTDIPPGRTYAYRIVARTTGGDEFSSVRQRVSIPVAGLTLGQNRPNPFNPTTTIRFSIPERAVVTLAVYGVDGRLVRKLIDGPMGAGSQTIEWDGTNESGQRVGTGVYFYSLSSGGRVLSYKMVVLK